MGERKICLTVVSCCVFDQRPMRYDGAVPARDKMILNFIFN